MIRLLCVDDDPLVRNYLTARLSAEPDIAVVASVATAAHAFAHLRREPLDVVLLDYKLADSQDGLQLLQAMRLWHHEPTDSRQLPRALFCTGWADPQFEASARELGASGVVAKEHVASDLIPAIRAVARGESWFGRLPSGTGNGTGTRWKALVAENDRRTRAQLAEILERMECSVTFAWRSEEILERLAHETFDILLLDHRLPGRMLGSVMLEQLAERWPGLPVLFLTAQPGVLESYRPAPNVLGVIRKPLSPQQLQSELGRALGRAAAA